VDYWLFDLLVLGVPIALLVGRTRPSAALLRATGALAVVALLWTAPWDEHLVRTGVWSYGPDRVLATIGSVPAEEYAFVVLLVALVAAWGHRTGRLPAGPAALSRGSRSSGALCWLAVALAGAGAVALGGQLRYLGLLLVWVAPPLALQRAVAGDLLARGWSTGRCWRCPSRCGCARPTGWPWPTASGPSRRPAAPGSCCSASRSRRRCSSCSPRCW
jgi:lycopene cyclase domain-containing protein